MYTKNLDSEVQREGRLIPIDPNSQIATLIKKAHLKIEAIDPNILSRNPKKVTSKIFFTTFPKTFSNTTTNRKRIRKTPIVNS